ncbi:MAG: hypothetical protein HQM03_08770 [Magnetococcales bacterium]|nr:hypothetical protein [Magnetococcales bacterium]
MARRPRFARDSNSPDVLNKTFIERVAFFLETGKQAELISAMQLRWVREDGPPLISDYSLNDIYGQLGPALLPRLAEPLLKILDAMRAKSPRDMNERERLHWLGALELAMRVAWQDKTVIQGGFVDLLNEWLQRAIRPVGYAQFVPRDLTASRKYGLVESDPLVAILRLASQVIPFDETGIALWKRVSRAPDNPEARRLAASRLWEIALWSAASAPEWLGKQLWTLHQWLESVDEAVGNIARFIALLDWSLSGEQVAKILLHAELPPDIPANNRERFCDRVDYYGRKLSNVSRHLDGLRLEKQACRWSDLSIALREVEKPAGQSICKKIILQMLPDGQSTRLPICWLAVDRGGTDAHHCIFQLQRWGGQNESAAQRCLCPGQGE